MELKELINQLEAGSEFRKWRSGSSFLAHAFVMLDDANSNEWQLGYFSPKTKKMTTFIVKGEKTDVVENEEIFSTGKEIIKLEPDEVKLAVSQALEIAEKLREERYSNEIPVKKFFIIQHLDIGSVFNITFFMQSLKTLNVKISSLDGKILKQSHESLVSGL